MTNAAKAKILVVNANSSKSVTEGMMEELAGPTKLFNIDIEYTQVDDAPTTIETTDDVHIAHRLTKEFIEQKKADAFVVACFCDPGVVELRAAGYQNVFGIGESAMHLAANSGGKFGMLSISALSVERHEEQVARAGLASMLAKDLPLDMGVLELEQMSAGPRILEKAKELVGEHGAKAIILGCAGMGGHRAWLQQQVGVPVIDPCWAGVSMAAAALGSL